MLLRSILTVMLLAVGFNGFSSPCHAADYAIVVSAKTHGDAAWKEVVAALQQKHQATVFEYENQISEVIDDLQQSFPRYTCFIAQPSEATRAFVAQVHQLTRTYDDDPYCDTLWGILTGYDAANAMEIAQRTEPLVIQKVGSGTDIAFEMCEQAVAFDELVKHKQTEKLPDGEAVETKGPADTTRALANLLKDYQADLFVTSGHATERNWQIGFTYRNGFFVSQEGQMYGRTTTGEQFEINSPNPKVYLPIGNCLMGHIDGPDAMALAWMNSCGVQQMIGYTVPTWFGYSGWGCLDYFLEQPGRYTFVEAYHANQHALIHRLNSPETSPGNKRGLKFDRDVVALYGDPKWSATMAPGPVAFEQSLTAENGLYTLIITPQRADKSFEPINTNGSQRGGRPIVQFFNSRLTNIKLIDGEGFSPVISDDFILVPRPTGAGADTIQIRFTADMVN